jgi:hypothetical protein
MRTLSADTFEQATVESELERRQLCAVAGATHVPTKIEIFNSRLAYGIDGGIARIEAQGVSYPKLRRPTQWAPIY